MKQNFLLFLEFIREPKWKRWANNCPRDYWR